MPHDARDFDCLITLEHLLQELSAFLSIAKPISITQLCLINMEEVFFNMIDNQITPEGACVVCGLNPLSIVLPSVHCSLFVKLEWALQELSLVRIVCPVERLQWAYRLSESEESRNTI